MEVPASGGGPSEPVPSAPTLPPPDGAEREACRYLSEVVAPYLTRARRPVLLRAVRTAAREGVLRPLSALPERQRRELLETIEERVDRARPKPTPRAIVRLTSVVAAAPVADRGVRRRLAPPAR